MITVKLKSRITFLHRVPSGYFFEDWWRKSDITYIRPRDGADARFGFTKMAKNCLNDPKWFLDPKNRLHWTAEENWTKHSFSFLKFIIFVDLERKNKFHGNHASHKLSFITQRFLMIWKFIAIRFVFQINSKKIRESIYFADCPALVSRKIEVHHFRQIPSLSSWIPNNNRPYRRPNNSFCHNLYAALPKDSEKKWKLDFRFIFFDENSCKHLVL